LNGKPIHVLTIKPASSTSLQEVITLLHNRHFQYKREQAAVSQ
jgi:hypothetical protein